MATFFRAFRQGRDNKPGHDELRGKAKFQGLPFESDSEKKFAAIA